MACLLGPKSAAPVGRWALWSILWANLIANQITAIPKCFLEVVGRVTEIVVSYKIAHQTSPK